MNMVALTANSAKEAIDKKTSHRKWRYKYNWKNAYRFVREKLIGFLFSAEIGALLERLAEQITGSLVAVRPGRKFARDMAANKNKGRTTQFNK